MAGTVAPNIVTDGLVLYLDAANTKSYPGSGNTWVDNAAGNNGTLTNGPTFNSSNGGSIVFDGVDDYIQLTNTWMWELGYGINIWIDLSNSEGAAKYFLGNNTTSQGVRYNSASQSFLVFNGTNGFLEIPYAKPNTWIMFTAKRLTSTLYECYVNGISIGNTNAGTGGATIQLNIIGKRSDGLPTDSKISSVTFYNKTLSQQEIFQNYNATKTRFGLT